MQTTITDRIEYQQIQARLSELALSQPVKEALGELRPFLSERECKAKMRETTDGTILLSGIGSPPLTAMKELNQILELAEKGGMLTPEQLVSVARFLATCRQMKAYLKKAEAFQVNIASYGGALDPLQELFDEIDRSIRNGVVDDSASPALRDVRRRIENAHSGIKTKLESILRGKKEWFADGYVATRNGRFVLPVKKEYKNQVNGTVIDTSGTGSTYFIEPTAVRKLQEALSTLEIEEDNEIRRILYTLTGQVDEQIAVLKINRDCMETLDFIFAKAKLSLEMKAIPVPIHTQGGIKIVGGRHPLLDQTRCIPLDFEIGGTISGVVITGPNTGGKTVALKTVGLLSMMAQSGLHVPAEEGTSFCMHSNVLCDIGDGQSITENLSTFSAHITNVIDILNQVTPDSLVLLDELGSGTDPAEGMGIAVAILEELRHRGCLFVATTHYPEIKEFAAHTQGLTNARMEFDPESLQPLFKLRIGEAGESCALYIAQRLGFPAHMLKRAHAEAYGRSAPQPVAVPEMVFSEEASAGQPTVLRSKIQRELPPKAAIPAGEQFQMGDSVMVYPEKQIGIVYRPTNSQGELCVQIKGKKSMVNHKRIKLITPASELYPADYDFSIVFESVENRKARHTLDRKHVEGVVVHCEDLA